MKQNNHFLIAPSLLSANTMSLGEEIKAVMDAGADMIHIDVMDQHYVPNITFGPMLCQSITKTYPAIVMDAHLMVTPVDALILQFIEAGVKRISIHPDATTHLDRSLRLIRERHCQAGLALNPTTSPECLQWCHYCLDFVLVMTVNPGFGGQSFIEEIIPKITWIQKHFPHLPIAVDGGVSCTNIAKLAKAGGTQFVVGSALFSTMDYRKTIHDMREQLDFLHT